MNLFLVSVRWSGQALLGTNLMCLTHYKLSLLNLKEKKLFFFFVSGVKIKVACTDSNGQVTMSREETTNWFGNYAVKFDGSPDLSGCYAQVSSAGQDSQSGCTTAAGPAQQLRLMFRMFNMEMYVVNSLLAQPSQPMSNCPRSYNPVPAPVTPANPPPVYAPVTPAPVTPTNPSPPAFRLPPLPHLPPLPSLPPMPPVPFLEATACSHE